VCGLLSFVSPFAKVFSLLHWSSFLRLDCACNSASDKVITILSHGACPICKTIMLREDRKSLPRTPDSPLLSDKMWLAALYWRTPRTRFLRCDIPTHRFIFNKQQQEHCCILLKKRIDPCVVCTTCSWPLKITYGFLSPWRLLSFSVGNMDSV